MSPTEYSDRTKADRFVPDPDPLLACSREDCESEAHWREIRDSDNWQASPDPAVELLCPSCLETRRRRRENQQLPETGEDRSERMSADCKECSWSVRKPTRQAALDAAKNHRRKSGHLVVLRGV